MLLVIVLVLPTTVVVPFVPVTTTAAMVIVSVLVMVGVVRVVIGPIMVVVVVWIVIVVRHRNVLMLPKIPVGGIRVKRRGTAVVVVIVQLAVLTLLAVQAKVPKVLWARIEHVSVVEEGRWVVLRVVDKCGISVLLIQRWTIHGRVATVPVNSTIYTAIVPPVCTWRHSVLLHVVMLLLLEVHGVLVWTAHGWSLSAASLSGTIRRIIVVQSDRNDSWRGERGEQWIREVIGQQATITEDRIGQQLIARVILDKILLHRVQQGALSLSSSTANVTTVVI